MVVGDTAHAERFDVIVVGGATAGFSAAIAAREHGAERVLLLEKAPEPEAGGNAVVSHTGFRFVQRGAEEIREFLPDVPPDVFARYVIRAYTEERFAADLQRVTRGRIDATLADILVRQSNAALHWMRDLGFVWAPVDQGVQVDGYKYFEPGLIIHPEGGGVGQYRTWLELGRQRGVDVRFESAVDRLLGSRRAIEGVRVVGPDGPYEATAPSVVLASGGFQANREMRARYLGPNADLMLVRGSRHDTGEILREALDLGASPGGHWQGAHATQIDASTPEGSGGGPGGANRYSYNYGITVNTVGARFYDEGEAEHAYTYAKTGWDVVRQEGGLAYQIFDQKTLHLLTSRYAKGEPVTADTVEELAGGIGVEPEVLTRTIADYNAAIDEDTPFDPGQRDGRGTSGLAVNKSNWALAIDQPPFVAYPVTGGVTFTFGGLEIDGDTRVQNTAGAAIEGLFANGDIIGLFYHNYPSCSGQTRNAVFGRIAGRNAAAHAATSAAGSRAGSRG